MSRLRLYNLRKSFAYAINGIVFCVRYERNMRIHIVAAAYVLFAALYFYELEPAELAVLVIAIVLVMTLEIINTAIEVITDKASPEYSSLAKAAKDTAAGAVLLAAAAAVAVGVILLWDRVVFGQIADFFTANPLAVALLGLSVILSVVFILTVKERRKRGKRKK